MATKKPVLMSQGHSDEFKTPDYALNPLLPYVNKKLVIWEPADSNQHLAHLLVARGYKVVVTNDDFRTVPVPKKWDLIVTNPPYSLKTEFLERCFELGKPFALLMPVSTLSGKRRNELFNKYSNTKQRLQMLIPDSRVDFITPSGKSSSAWFPVAWFVSQLELLHELNFIPLEGKCQEKRLPRLSK